MVWALPKLYGFPVALRCTRVPPASTELLVSLGIATVFAGWHAARATRRYSTRASDISLGTTYELGRGRPMSCGAPLWGGIFSYLTRKIGKLIENTRN